MSYTYTYDSSGNMTGLTYGANLSVSGCIIPTISGYVYPILTLSSLIYKPITISNYISLSGLFSGYSSYLSLSGVIASSSFFYNYLTSSSYISPFVSNYTISSSIYYITTTPYINSTPWTKQYSTYLIGTLDISSQLIVRGNIICPNIIDQYARNYELSLSGYVWSYYNNLGSQVNVLSGSTGVDQYARNYELSLSGYVWSYYKTLGNLINSDNNIDQYARDYELSLSGYLWSYYKTLGNLINTNTNIDQYARDYEISLSGNVNSQAFRIGALENKTMGLTYNGSTGINSNLYMGSSNNSIYMSDAGLYMRGLGDQNHYIKYNATRNGPCIGGYAGGGLGIAVPSYTEILGWNSSGVYINGDLTSNNLLSISSRITALEYKTTGFTYNGNSIMNSSIYLNNNALYLRGDTNHYIKYDSTRDGPQLQGYGGGSLGALNNGVYSEIIGYNNTSIQLNKPVYCNYNLIVTNDINCNGNLNHGYLYISSSGTYNLSMSAGYKYVFINASNVYINLGQGANYTNIIYFINLNGSNNVNYTVYGSLNNNWLYSSLWLIWCPNNTWKYFTM